MPGRKRSDRTAPAATSSGSSRTPASARKCRTRCSTVSHTECAWALSARCATMRACSCRADGAASRSASMQRSSSSSSVAIDWERLVAVGAPLFWGRGPDGWPLLAISLGGWYQVTSSMASDRPAAVHVLEASTGRELHQIEGLHGAKVADFDGDGLGDLWGEAEGQLTAVRGPMPEAWRALGYFAAAGRYSGPPDEHASHTADLDGDGIGDALTREFLSPNARNAPGTRTVLARSGRDGHASGRHQSMPSRHGAMTSAGPAMRQRPLPCPRAISTATERATCSSRVRCATPMRTTAQERFRSSCSRAEQDVISGRPATCVSTQQDQEPRWFRVSSFARSSPTAHLDSGGALHAGPESGRDTGDGG